jgi:hypothetical protein
MPFNCDRCVVDTNVLSDFYEADCLEIIWDLFTGGVWVDPYVCEELKRRFGIDVALCLQQKNLAYHYTNNLTEESYIEMAEIKARKNALKTADILCIIYSKLNDATCLSADGAVVRICVERDVKVARHGGILEEALRRRHITKQEALRLFTMFLGQGLMMSQALRQEFIQKFS